MNKDENSNLTSDTAKAQNLQTQLVNIFAPDDNSIKDGSIASNSRQKAESQISINKNFLLNKTCWVSPSSKIYDQLIEYLKENIERGRGETILEIGIAEGEESGLNQDEMDASVATLKSMEAELNAVVKELREKQIGDVVVQNKNCIKYVKEFLIRKQSDMEDFTEVRVAVVGNVDAGKSTLLGVLTHCVLDDGRGNARTKLFRHKHEIESGRTSSVGNDILGFDAGGQIVNEPDTHGAVLDWGKICRLSSKVITFIDLAGHEKYLKTTIFGMMGHSPDFCILMVGSNMGIVGMTKEHLGLALALNVPVFVVVTKIDMCPPIVLQETLRVLQRILRSPGCRKIPVLVQNTDDVITCAMNFTSEKLCPIFQVSNVTGENLDLLKSFLNLLYPRMEALVNEPAEFLIDDLYSVPGVGTVVSGTCLKGVVKVNESLLLGPDAVGKFRPTLIKSIHRKRLPVQECKASQTASCALKKLKRSELRKGMVLVSEKLNPVASFEFEAEILVLHHPTTISVNYQAMIHCGSIRQTATITDMSLQHLRTGDKAIVKFRFIKNPEYLKPEMKLVFREGRTKAVGTITKVNLEKQTA